MENFLSKFANADTQVQSSNANLSVSPEFHGTIDISKGALKMKIGFYAKLYKTKYENFVSLDDWEVHDESNIEFDGIPVDDINALRQSMTNSGLSTLAKGLEINNNQIKKEIATQIGQSKPFKAVYGKTAVMHDTLSDEDKKKVWLKYAIDNYHSNNAKIEINMFSSEDEEGNKVAPSYEQLVEMYNQLNQ